MVRSGTVEWSVLQLGKGKVELVSDGLATLEDALGGNAPALNDIKGGTVLVMPTERLLLRVMSLPAVDNDELAGMVELQVDKFSPFPIDLMVISFEIIQRSEDEIQVLVAAARESVIDAAADSVRKFGGTIQRVDAGLLGFWKNVVDAKELTDVGLETLVLVSGGSIELLTHENGVLKALSCLGRAPNLSDPAICNDIATDVAHLLMEQDLEFGRSGRRRLTLWGDAQMQPFVNSLQKICNAEVSEKSLGILPGFTYGCVMRSAQGGRLLDLTPKAWLDDEAKRLTKKRLIAGGIVFLCIWGTLVGGGLGWLKLEKMRLQRLRKIDEQWSGPAKQVRHLRLQVRMIERYTDHTYSSLECLRAISRVQPDGVDLTSFTYRKGEGIHLDGEADSSSLVNRFNESLTKSELFADVKSGACILNKKGRYRFSFDIKFPEEEL
jgi:hypothetical protein